MKAINSQGHVIYYNCVIKHDKIRYQIQAASGQAINREQRESPCQAAGALPNFPILFRKGFTGQGIKEFPKRRAEY